MKKDSENAYDVCNVRIIYLKKKFNISAILSLNVMLLENTCENNGLLQ